MPPVLVVVGDVMTDVVARLHGGLVAGGDAPADVVVRPGGSAANLAVAAAAAGVEAHLFACVGDDTAAKGAAVALRSAGVRIHLGRGEAPTGSVVALVHEDGGRTMVSDRGANRELRLPAALAGDHLHVSGYVLVDAATREVGLAALRRAASAGMSTSVDASPGVGQWLPEADWCCLNLEEARALAAGGEPDALLERFAAVAVTLGAGGALLAERGRPPLRRAALPARVVDTTGAGDAFAGTWVARRLAGDGPEAAVDAALAAAARVVEVVGAGWAR